MSSEADLNRAKELLEPALNCFGGEDGGVSFVKLRSLVVRFIEESEKGSEASHEIIMVIERFNRLISITKGN